MRLPNIVEIQKVSIITKEKAPVDISRSLIEKITITEELDSMGAVGELIFFDKGNINESTPILGGEKLEIILIDALQNIRKYKFIIINKPGIDIQDMTYYMHIKLSIVEEDYFNILTKSYTNGIMSYTDTVSDLIYKIFSKSLSTDVVLSNMLISKKIGTNIPNNLSFPMYYTIEQCINYLLKFLSSNSTGGYYFYKNRALEKYELISVKDLINNKYIAKFNVNRMESFDYVQEMEIYDSTNVLDSINSSLINARYITNDNKNIKYNSVNINDVIKKYNIKGTAISKEALALSNNNNTILYSPTVYNDDSSSDRISYENDILYNIFTAGKARIRIDGRFNLNIGDKIYLDLPAPEIVDSAKFYAGEWSIIKIENIIGADGQYHQYLYIVKYDTFNNKQNSRIIGLKG